MNDKRRLTRVRWVKEASLEESVPSERNPTPWTDFPGEKAFQPGIEAPAGDYELGEEEYAGEDYAENEEAVWDEVDGMYSYGLPVEDDLDGMDEEIWLEDDAYLEQDDEPGDVKHPLSSALLVLIALYIACGLAPLFVALFVSLRVFFWLEIGGWAIILAWLIIGVRPPLILWIKERKKASSEQLLG